jgi:hypothetical protein
MRRLAAPFVVAPPTGARIRTRLRPSAADERVLGVVGEHLGRLAGQDLAVRCRLGHGDDQRTDRKRALTSASSSRWAGALTRSSNDQWQRAQRNLLDARAGLRRACRTVQARLAVPVGGRDGRGGGYGSRAERFHKRGAPAAPASRACRGGGTADAGAGVGVPRWPAARQAPPRP